MKYKKIIVLLLSTVLISLFASVPVASASEVCNDVNEFLDDHSMGFLQSDCQGDEVVSFIGFEGGLSAPTKEGLDPTLTRAGTAREFIVNTINFALTFLGVIALAIVVYGGFLYVTAAGNEEQSGKGKKTITYAVIGILIIVASYGIVNTLIKFAGGGGSDRAGGGGDRGAATSGLGSEEGTNIGQQTIYSLAAQALNSSLNDFVFAYKNLVTMNGLIIKLEGLPEPADDPRESENRKYVSTVSNVVSEIKNSANSLSKTHLAAKKLLDTTLAPWASADLNAEQYENGALKGMFTTALTSSGLKEAYKQDFIQVIDDLVGPKGRLIMVKKILGEIAQTPAKEVINRGLISEKDIQRAFSGIDPETTIKDIFQEVLDGLDQARTLQEDPGDSQKVLVVVRALDRLYIIVKNVEFVFVKIKATVRQGNAPLIVELNGLDSRDPAGATITDDRYQWDAMGTAGNIDDAAAALATALTGSTEPLEQQNVGRLLKDVQCKPGSTGPAITCTYNQPGTYIVRLKIPSQDPSRVATGQAFLPITVLPSVARIALTAKIGSITEELRKYEQDASGKWRLVIDKHEFQVTSEEATKGKGVEFDASQSQAGSNATISSFEWTYGDGSGAKDTIANPAHKYKTKGKFQMKLEVADTGGRKDRMLLNVNIGSLAARILAPSEEAEPDELIEFDGSASRSDKGAISSYEWKIESLKPDGSVEKEIKSGDKDTNGNVILNVLGDATSPTLRVKFKKSGAYKVNLTVSDGSESMSADVPIYVKSRKPRANFFLRTCPDACPDPSKPNLIELDASPSFDPDRDALSYIWTIIDANGNELTKDQSFEVLAGKTLTDKIIRVRFFKPGTYKIKLAVTDQLPAEIQQTDERIKEVTIASTVELSWGEIPTSARLHAASPGQASQTLFHFKGKVSNADQLRIDFGDNFGADLGVTSGTDVDFDFAEPHPYSQAGTYLVKLTATSSEGNGENTIMKRIYIQGGDEPLAIIEASVDGVPIVLADPMQDAFETIRRKSIQFSGVNSMDSRGVVGNVTYSWNFGDGSPMSTERQAQHSYENVSPETEPFKVTLKVADKDDSSKIKETYFLVNVVSKKPIVNTIAIEKISAGNVTPIDVKVTAEGASDPDGEIQTYQFWYFDPADANRQLAPQTQTGKENNFATLTIETSGEEGEEHTYAFCVSVTDKENTTSECREMFQDAELPRLTVTNGANEPPTVDFTIDKNQVKVNEPVTFTANVTDPEGKPIAAYIWDFDGNGFQDDQPITEATATHTYTRQSRGSGYLVKLKAIDDKGASGFSQAIPVVVSANSNPPTSKFTCQVAQDNPLKVSCYDQSTADTANGARLTKWTWDFDTGKQYGCDVEEKPAYCNDSKTDDIDSSDQNPTFTYPAGESGQKQIQLTVEDSDGNTAESKIFVQLVPGTVGVTPGAAAPHADILNAVITARGTRPGVQSQEIPVPGCTPSNSPECKRKIIRIPTAGTGTPVAGENITFFYGESTGNIGNYKIDKNIWCDADGDGDRMNDWDNQNNISHGCEVAQTGEPAENCWTTEYKRRAKTPGSPEGPGHFMARLRAEDATDPLNTYRNEDLEVIFQGTTRPDEVLSGNDCNGNLPGSTGSASLFKKLGTQNTILLGLIAGVIVVLIGSGAASFLRRGKRRTH